MLIIGAGGLVLQMLDDLLIQTKNGLTCWADRPVENTLLRSKCCIISSDADVLTYFTHQDNRFLLAVGNPAVRVSLTKKFEALGGIITSFFSPHANISSYATIGKGTVVLHGSIIEAGSVLGTGVLVNSNCTICHEAFIGDFSEIGPGTTITGRVSIGKNCFLGSGTTVIPGISIEDAVIVGAGSVIITPISKGDKIAGIPAKSIRK